MKDLIQQLEEQFPEHPHIFSQPGISLTEWKKQGRPHNWLPVEEAKGHKVFVDVGYGGIIVVKDGNLLAWGKNEIVRDDIVVIDANYYGISNHIYFPAKNERQKIRTTESII